LNPLDPGYQANRQGGGISAFVPGGGANPRPGAEVNKEDDRKTQDGSLRRDESVTLSQIMGGGKKARAARQVTEEQGR